MLKARKTVYGPLAAIALLCLGLLQKATFAADATTTLAPYETLKADIDAAQKAGVFGVLEGTRTDHVGIQKRDGVEVGRFNYSLDKLTAPDTDTQNAIAVEGLALRCAQLEAPEYRKTLLWAYLLSHIMRREAKYVRDTQEKELVREETITPLSVYEEAYPKDGLFKRMALFGLSGSLLGALITCRLATGRLTWRSMRSERKPIAVIAILAGVLGAIISIFGTAGSVCFAHHLPVFKAIHATLLAFLEKFKKDIPASLEAENFIAALKDDAPFASLNAPRRVRVAAQYFKQYTELAQIKPV